MDIYSFIFSEKIISWRVNYVVHIIHYLVFVLKLVCHFDEMKSMMAES